MVSKKGDEAMKVKRRQNRPTRVKAAMAKVREGAGEKFFFFDKAMVKRRQNRLTRVKAVMAKEREKVGEWGEKTRYMEKKIE